MCGLSFTIILSHLALCSTGAHAHGSALLTQCLDLTNGKINIEDELTLPVEHQVQKEYTGKEMAFCRSHLFFDCPLEMSPFPFKPYSQLTPVSLLVLCPEAITMAIWVLAGVGPSMTLPRAQPCLVLTLQVPGQTSTPGAISSRHIVWSLKWFLCLSMGVICVVYFSERESRRTPGKELCRGNFLIWQNLPEHAQDWLEIMSLWLFFIVLMYVTVKLAGESGES